MIRAMVEEIDGLYGLFLDSLKSAFVVAVSSSITAHQFKSKMALSIRDVDYRYSQQMNEAIEPVIESVASTSVAAARSLKSDVSVSVNIQTLREELVKHFMLELSLSMFSQMNKDILFIQKKVKHLRLNVEMIKLKNGSSEVEAMAAEKAKEAQLGFIILDSLGRKRSSANHIHIQAKFALASLYNEIQILEMNAIGTEFAYVDNPGGALHGLKFDVSRFQELRQTYFHPNSFALVSGIVTI